MISWDFFLSLVVDRDVLGRRIDRDAGQLAAVSAAADDSLFIVAGPGSGKTTVLALRVLRLVFVDRVDPQAILATTFTKKAATELRSRILSWGDQLRRALLAAPGTAGSGLEHELRRMDLNRVTTGTLDSIAEQTLADYREPGTQPPIPLDQFVADAQMLRLGLWRGQRHLDPEFVNYVQFLRGGNWQKHKLEACRDARERFLHDQVDVDAFERGTANAGASVLREVVENYAAGLEERLVTDFAGLEQEFLNRLSSGLLNRFVDSLEAVLVDEYQDTNLLQERIYFALGAAAVEKGGSMAVVGDDDQSLYRFRGATVELFANFPDRLHGHHRIAARPIYLQTNYRSTRSIVAWYSAFVDLDSAYGSARVNGKPLLLAGRTDPYDDYPVLGIFRPDAENLARALASFLDDVFNGSGVVVGQGGAEFRISRNPDRGAAGDCALLCGSPRERTSRGRERLPLLLRRELDQLPSPIEVFNPRGQELNEALEVRQLCGLILECIDPNAQVQNDESLPRTVANIFNNWRAEAWQYINSNPTAPGSAGRRNTLNEFVRAWQRRSPQGSGRWPQEVALIDLLYQLVTWIPTFQENPEGLIFLEAITRTITQMAPFAYDSAVHRDAPRAQQSVKQILWNIMGPLASGAIDIDEDLIEQLPRDRLQIMSIHQAKGLEFPLVMVDVASDFTMNHALQAYARFPNGGATQTLEDALRPFSSLGTPLRSARDRAFDDLIRQYFVAFSRPQDVLVLVGLGDASNGPKPSVKNVATGYTRNDQRRWDDLPRLVYI